MEKSVVYVSMKEDNNINCSYAIVDKGEKSVIIIFKDLECVIYDYELFSKDDFDYKYLLLKHYEDETSAYKDFMKIIGKMCKKSIDSKYFKNHIVEDNIIAFRDDKNEHTIVGERKQVYIERYTNLSSFIKLNKSNFVK